MFYRCYQAHTYRLRPLQYSGVRASLNPQLPPFRSIVRHPLLVVLLTVQFQPDLRRTYPTFFGHFLEWAPQSALRIIPGTRYLEYSVLKKTNIGYFPYSTRYTRTIQCSGVGLTLKIQNVKNRPTRHSTEAHPMWRSRISGLDSYNRPIQISVINSAILGFSVILCPAFYVVQGVIVKKCLNFVH